MRGKQMLHELISMRLVANFPSPIYLPSSKFKYATIRPTLQSPIRRTDTFGTMSSTTQPQSAPPFPVLYVSPFPTHFYNPIAVLHLLAFSGQSLLRWWAASPSDAIIRSPEEITPRRLQRYIRNYGRWNGSPHIVVVAAVVEGEVVGVAVWYPPKRFWRKETIAQFAYRKSVEAKDRLEDLLFPRTWVRAELESQYYKQVEETRDRLLGPDYESNTWYLDILAVHPDMQRKGFGSALLEWGLKQALENGERVYLEATEPGYPLYVKRGFVEIGSFTVRDSSIVMPYMIWPSPPQL
jgi:GNAT superfamily N-acetyltransferase